ncbi:MAG: cytochrome c3 family protein [Anaerolineae bacterium]|jgi:predicted CXXCH cytochrome family protein
MISSRHWKPSPFLAVAILASLVLVMLLAQGASAQESSPPSNETCLVCHAREGLEMELNSGQLLPVTVDEDVLDASVHGSLQCTDCHTDIVGYPHGDIQARDHRDLTIHYSQACANCHEDQALKQVDSVHARVQAAGIREAAVCADCHGSHDIQPISREKHPEIDGTVSADTCQTCHSGIHEKYRNSVHGVALYNGDPNVPTCIDCHPPHTAVDPRTLEFRLNSPELCASCHADKELMAAYGISTEVFDTYVADFHGTTVMLFEKTSPDQPTNKAVCIDCHGVHEIQPAGMDDLALKENLVTKCQECHPDATPNFASSWMGHYSPNWERYPLVTAVTWFYRIVIPATIGFFVVYIILDAQRRIRNRRARGREVQA